MLWKVLKLWNSMRLWNSWDKRCMQDAMLCRTISLLLGLTGKPEPSLRPDGRQVENSVRKKVELLEAAEFEGRTMHARRDIGSYQKHPLGHEWEAKVFPYNNCKETKTSKRLCCAGGRTNWSIFWCFKPYYPTVLVMSMGAAASIHSILVVRKLNELWPVRRDLAIELAHALCDV